MIIDGCNCRLKMDMMAMDTCDICRSCKVLAVNNIIHAAKTSTCTCDKHSLQVCSKCFDNTKPDPKPLTIKKAIKYLRKHPEVESMTLSGMKGRDYSPSDVLFEYSSDISKYIIGYQDIFEIVPIYKTVYTNKLKISLIKDSK